jgi:hypothetical protein
MIEVGQVWVVSERATQRQGLLGHINPHNIVPVPVGTKFVIKEIRGRPTIWISGLDSLVTVITSTGDQVDLLKCLVEDYADLLTV